MSYATLDEVKEHLRYEPSDTSNDMVFQVYIDASTQVINDYITDSVTDEMLPRLKAATFLLCGFIEHDRDAQQTMTPTPSFSGLPHPVEMLLRPYRKPTVV